MHNMTMSRFNSQGYNVIGTSARCYAKTGAGDIDELKANVSNPNCADANYPNQINTDISSQ